MDLCKSKWFTNNSYIFLQVVAKAVSNGMILEEPINTVVVFGGYQYFIILIFDEKGKT